MKSHERRFVEAIKMVQDAGQNIQAAGERLAVGVKSAWGTLDKLASDYGMRLAETIKQEGRTISTTASGQDYEAAEEFHSKALQGTNRIISAVRKYVPRLHRSLKPELNTLNTVLTKLEASVKKLGTALDESPGSQIQSLQREARNLSEITRELLAVRAEVARESQRLREVEAAERTLTSLRTTLESREEFSELRRLEKALSSKEEEIKQFLQPLTKPLVKLERTLSSKDDALVNSLHAIVDRPIPTLVTGQRFLIIRVLDILQEYMKLGKIAVEDRKRRKAEEVILASKEGMIERLREEYLSIQANLTETLRQLKASGLMRQLEELDMRTAETAQTKKTILDRQRDLQRRIEQLTQSVTKMKKDIESEVEKIVSRRIMISTP